MNPNDQTQTTPEQPTNPAMVASPQVATAPQQPYQPVATVGQPTVSSNPQMLSEKANTYIKRVSVTAIIIGVLLVIIGVLLGLFMDITSFVNVPIGIIYLVYASKLRKPGISVKQIVLACKVIIITVFIGFVIGIYFGAGSGFLQLLLAFFIAQLVKELYETGLTTTKSPLTTKAKV